MVEKTKIGFVGLGDMGGAIAERILAAGFPTSLWARRPESLAPFIAKGAKPADDLRALARSSEIVGVCVFNDDDVKAVLTGEAGLIANLPERAIILIHSTISVEACEALEQEGRARGVFVLDAPVSGAREGALDGELAIMVGGDESAFARALPVMQTYGRTIRRLGAIGSGQKMKVLNNVTSFCNGAIARQAIEIGVRLGLDQAAVIEILRNSSGRSFSLEMLVQKLLGDPVFTAHAATMIAKDTDLFKQVCRTAGIERTMLEEVALTRRENPAG